VNVQLQRRHGARFLEVWFDGKARKAFCLIEASSAACALAVHREAGGLRADRVYQVSSTNRQGEDMTAPLIFIGTYQVREGKLEAYKEFWQEYLKYIEAREPRLISINMYVSDDGNEVSVVQVHPDADSMLFHAGVAQQHIGTVYEEYLTGTANTQIYGTPNEATLAMVDKLNAPGSSVSIKRTPVGGFSRFAAVPEGAAASR